MSKDNLTRLFKSKHFCMAPWVHIHTHPTGETYLCCYSRGIAELGNTKSNSLEEIWNSDRMKQTRVNMLNDVPSDECSKCYEKENAGFNNSMRTHFNKYFGKYIPLTNQTKPDGTFNDFKIRYFDIRFSNLCNFRCRICSPNFSSNWYGDYKKLNIPVEHSQVIYPGKTEDDMLQQIGPHIEHLDQIYFAGGEPLIMKEHWVILDSLIEQGRTDVRLVYNTNFSETTFKGRDVFEIWKKFQSVNVLASLDDDYSRAEYSRKGTDWQQVLDNRNRMMEICPAVMFGVSSTLSVLNAWHLPDFHRDWIERGLASPDSFTINIVQFPNYLRVDVLPIDLKNKIKDKYLAHIEWLKQFGDRASKIINEYQSSINYMLEQDQSHLLEECMRNLIQVDNIREEDFFEVFPEYIELKQYVKT